MRLVFFDSLQFSLHYNLVRLAFFWLPSISIPGSQPAANITGFQWLKWDEFGNHLNILKHTWTILNSSSDIHIIPNPSWASNGFNWSNPQLQTALHLQLTVLSVSCAWIKRIKIKRMKPGQSNSISIPKNPKISQNMYSNKFNSNDMKRWNKVESIQWKAFVCW